MPTDVNDAYRERFAMSENRKILKEAFLSWDNIEIRRLKRYAEGNVFLCGKFYHMFLHCGMK